ncbi:MAG: helix-turn-helix domain-containing protein [Candidatus Omnitrophota bacterium]|nr:MAG: helix-turn-helix domain-containing protein [Candidatus Omnitrophota bacterium]
MKKFIESYTVEELAEAVKLHPYTIRRLCREGKIPCFKFGGQWRFDIGEIEEWRRNQNKSQLAPNR